MKTNHLTKFALFAVSLMVSSGHVYGNMLPTSRDDLSEKDRKRVEAVTRPTEDFSKSEKFEVMSSGGATSMDTTSDEAFNHPTAGISLEEGLDFEIGDSLFEKIWVSSPSSTQASDGLGPLYNARSCGRCHVGDGRGHPPEGPDDSRVSMFLRLSIPARTDEEKNLLRSRELLRIPEPTYGGQFQDVAVPGIPAEGKMNVSYEEFSVPLSDGETVTLRRPTYTVSDLGFGPMDPDMMMSPRVSPQLIGLGLLEAIHPADLLAKADEEDRDGDGISGKPSYINLDGKLAIGRFGWKASHATLRLQSADAFLGDIGLSTEEFPFHWGDCTLDQKTCRSLPHGAQEQLGPVEVPKNALDLVTFYVSNLSVPARRNHDDPDVLKGKEQFYGAGCTSCHTPKYVTRRDAAQKQFQFQLIWPYTDLLLHDMGEGLADHRPVGDASGREWKTPPLWGIGMTKLISGHTNFLHDGRARNLLEAIMWHGGEAELAKNAVAAMSKEERSALIKFLESL